MTRLGERIASVERGWVIEHNRLHLVKELQTQSEWDAIGVAITERAESSVWALGDWLVEGGRENRNWFGGSTYDHAVEVTGYSRAHLSNAYRTAVAFPPESRRIILSYSVHKESLRLPEELRRAALDKAEKHRWSADDMVEHVNEVMRVAAAKHAPGKEQNALVKKSMKKKPTDYYQAPKVRCPKCSHTFPIKGHKVGEHG